MIVCTNCRKEMVCCRTGVLVLFGTSHGYAGDEFECPECGNKTIDTNASPYQVPPLQVEAARESGRLREMP
ncbi:MAG: hypothetical protein C0610_16660 [Desulfobacteraceae bacterium]|nr:MAG: hypothetical protein C0610_16660 [Desulfobacteraceae bacterium]